MSSYAVFLRGVNVGGITIKMGDLKEVLKSRPFTGVKTLLASGNVVLSSELSPAGVKEQFEACLREAFGYDAWVVVLSADRVSELVAACPYPADDTSTHTYLTLGSDAGVLGELYTAGSALDGTELTRLGPEALAWLAPAGGTLDSPFSKLSSKPKYKASTTTRNLRTMIKVRDAAALL
ncbi:DUF1697 domain-containing protein [Arthrobacter sp. Leaf69]|uniref:DUF1697 domain-containing protein n=1 Tax=Arthrobacter sp. Leaf69 TaxID=1736232 RepID=UPI0006F9B7EC|nr:DUF1697 domain-containing protein [Arthrobacter sp. Leaf69]KQN95393.1 pyridoxamine 5-phosphate oxidase [Arthrobacter sp. Leaf69]